MFGGKLQAIKEVRKPTKPSVWVWVRHRWLKADPDPYPSDPYPGTQQVLKPIMCTNHCSLTVATIELNGPSMAA